MSFHGALGNELAVTDRTGELASKMFIFHVVSHVGETSERFTADRTNHLQRIKIKSSDYKTSHVQMHYSMHK